MKRFLWLSVIFIAGLLASCSLVSASVVTLNPVTYPNDMVYPGDIIIQNYAEGVNISTWFQNDSTPTFGHQAGSDMAIEIYNSHDTTAIFSVTVDNPPPLSYTTGTVSGQSGSPTIIGTGNRPPWRRKFNERPTDTMRLPPRASRSRPRLGRNPDVDSAPGRVGPELARLGSGVRGGGSAGDRRDRPNDRRGHGLS